MLHTRPFTAMPEEEDSSVIPDWVPELAPGTRADVYPVDGPSHAPFAELLLDRSAVTSGYSERKQAYEFWSCLSGNPDFRSTNVPLAAPPGALSLAADADHASHSQDKLARMLTKIRAGVSNLRRARPSKLQRIELETIVADDIDPADKKKPTFPYQKPSASSSLEDWFNKLSSGGSFSTAELAGAVPLGPAIARAAGKVLEMMANLGVPTQRAAWYIRIAVLNECVKQVPPDRSPRSPRVFWTRQLCSLLKTELDAIRARKTSSLGTMDRLQFWNYVLDLARWQSDEDLLDSKAWLDRVAASARTELLSSPAIASNGAKIAVAAVQRFLPQFCADRVRVQALRDALMPTAGYLLGAAYAALHGTSTPRRGQVRQPQPPLASTTSKVVFNNATIHLASFLGSVGSQHVANSRLEADAPEKYTAEAVIEKALELVTERNVDLPSKNDRKEGGAVADSSPTKLKSKKNVVGNGAADVVSPLDATAALEEFPAVGNPAILLNVLRQAFAGRGGDRAAVDHICRWASAASTLDVSQVTATAAAAVDLLAGPAVNTSTAPKNETLPEPLTKKVSVQSNDTSVSNSRPVPPAGQQLPVFHREIWVFLKDLGEDDDRETVFFDDRVAWLIARMCRVGVFSLSAFVRDVARLTSLAHHSSARLVRYVQLLPEPEDRQSADSRRALLRRNGVLPSRADGVALKATLDQILQCIRDGSELASIKQGARLKEQGDIRVIFAVIDSVVDEISDAQDEKPENFGVLLRPTVSFLRAVGASSLATDYVLDRMARLVSAAAEKSQTQVSGNSLYIALIAGLECMYQLAPLFAATNRLSAALGVLGRMWHVTVGGAGQPRIRVYVERTALVFGKYFCGRPASDHARWKEFVVGVLPSTNFATTKPLYCALLSGHLQALIEQQGDLQKPLVHTLQALLSSSTKCVIQDLGKYKWHSSGLDQLLGNKKSNLRKLLVARIGPAEIDRFYKDLLCVNHVAEGVIIPVLRVSARLNAVKNGNPPYRLAIDNITSIVGSVWMEALGDEMRPVFAIEIVALVIVGALFQYSGAASALDALASRPWLQRLTALHAGKPFFDRLHRTVLENLPRDAGIALETVADTLVTTVSTMCGKSPDDEGGIIRGIGLEPLGSTQMQLCCQYLSRVSRRSHEDFVSDACETLVTLVSKDECASMTKMILQCYEKQEEKVIAAGHIGLRAVEVMAESLDCFITGITVENPQDSFLNQQRSSEWFDADEARRAILHTVADYIGEEQCGQVADLMRTQMMHLVNRFAEASSKNCLPRDVSQDGIRTSGAIEARTKILLKLCKKTPKLLHWESLACAAARLLKAAVAFLSPVAVEQIIELLRVCVAQVDAVERAEGVANGNHILGATGDSLDDACDVHGPDMLRAELVDILNGIHTWLEPEDSKKLRKATGELAAGGLPQSVLSAKDADGANVDAWYLLEGYGRGEGEQPAIPMAAFGGQGDVLDEVNKKSVRLKRTYSTFSCLVR